MAKSSLLTPPTAHKNQLPIRRRKPRVAELTTEVICHARYAGIEISVDGSQARLLYGATMKTATVRDLRNHYTSVLRWVSAGEDVLITQRGKVIARLSPETDQSAQAVDWASSPEVLRDRSGDPVLTAEESAEILKEAGGRW